MINGESRRRMASRRPEEDIQSEIGPSEIGHKTLAPPVYYRVTLAGSVFDRTSIADKCFECTFITRGMDDQTRMKRAVYFFDVSLFNQGLQRHKLLTTIYSDSSRVTHMMYTSIIDAYNVFSTFLERINSEISMYVIALDRLTQAPIVHTSTPLVRRLHIKPEQIKFGMTWCHRCLRISEGTHPEPYTCAICSRECASRN